MTKKFCDICEKEATEITHVIKIPIYVGPLKDNYTKNTMFVQSIITTGRHSEVKGDFFPDLCPNCYAKALIALANKISLQPKAEEDSKQTSK